MSKQLDAKIAHDRLRQALIALRKAEGNAVILFAEILRLSESIDKLPHLKAGIEPGRVPWTKARQIVKVATPATEKRWIEMAAEKSRRELERQVAASRARRCSTAMKIRPGETAPSTKRPRGETAAIPATNRPPGGDRGNSSDKSSTRVDAGTPYQVVVYQCEACQARALPAKVPAESLCLGSYSR